MAVNLSESTVKRIAREFLQQGKVESPEKRGRMSGCGAMENTDNFMEGVIRRRIHRFYLEKQHPTLVKVLAAPRDEAGFQYGRTTLQNYQKNGIQVS